MSRKLTTEDLVRIRENAERWARAPRVYRTMRCGHPDYVPDFLDEKENDCWACRKEQIGIGLTGNSSVPAKT